MSFLREALRDKPVALYMMDDTAPFQDYSGYNRNGILEGNGTVTTGMGLVAGTTNAPVFGPTLNASLASPVFKKGKERDPFTLEMWFRVIAPGNLQQVFSNFGTFDGITVAGNVINFGTRYASGANAIVSYDIQEAQTVHIVGVHTANKNSLYINGEMVGEVTLENIGPAETYATTGDQMYVGGSSSTNQTFGVNGIGIYAGALPAEAIKRHYEAGIKLPTADSLISAFKGVRIPMSLSNANIFLDQWWTTDEQWEAASLFNVAVVQGQLRPQFSGDVSVPGQWLDSFVLSAAGTTSIYGVSANWDGKGIKIEASVDGTNWVVVQRGVNISVVPAGFNPTDRELQIRVSFTGGVVEDEAYLDNLNFVGLTTNLSPVTAGRTVIFSNAYPEREYRPLALHENWGAQIGAGGFIQITPDVLESSPVRTVEVWFKARATDFGANFGAGTYYVNGVAGTGYRVGEWNVTTYVASADYTGSLFFNNNVQIGQVVIYPTALTAAQVASIYAKATGTSVVKVTDSNSVVITEDAPASKIYAYDWTIQPTG